MQADNLRAVCLVVLLSFHCTTRQTAHKLRLTAALGVIRELQLLVFRGYMNWRLTIIAWLLFFVGLGIELSADYSLRMRDGNIRTGGLSPNIYYGVQTILFLSALFLGVIGVSNFKKRIIQFFVVSIQIAIGFILYIYILFSYVLGTGIDSL